MSNQEMELLQAAALTFEQLGFMYPMPEREDRYRDEVANAAASVRFEGPLEGRLTVTVSGNLLPVIAANMLGQDGVPPEAQQQDALGEIANVVCGNILPRIAGPRTVFNIAAPEVVVGSVPAEFTSGALAAKVSIPLDEGRADLLLLLSNGFREAAQ